VITKSGATGGRVGITTVEWGYGVEQIEGELVISTSYTNLRITMATITTLGRHRYCSVAS